ncbi:sulfite oxidase heme-binding subunit YedZ [Rhodoferax sp. U11-2br]|uniref:sulfite oxidase heme-binding subunit YedZ n=1 Tax=Rhodoferax sp. U11-2br TaxID=2838878 RepID=UPI001BE922D9|nr:protein-methionine-sulfoxide reductase heme-binding subunit MsrQ [Rhodoferax sp. U11-2br]MBT3068682.1 sulfoxide reductase heme-binding subunit YedZ [Rhodoferax sp. U11-2br]
MVTVVPTRRWAAGVNALCLHPWSKPLLFGLMLLPLCVLVSAAVFDQLGANPAQALVRSTGDWTLRALCLVLALTPLRVSLQLPALARWRRMLGLFVFFYASLHLLCYSWFDMGFELLDIARDIPKRPFILVGFAAFVLLFALALTSPHRVVRWMGGKNWRRLHQLVYAVAGLALLHFFWMRAGKNDVAEVWVYTFILSLLLGWRLVRVLKSLKKVSLAL